MEQKNIKLPTYIIKIFLDLYNFIQDDGTIFILQSHHLGNKKSSKPMNFHCLIILAKFRSCNNKNMMPKELVFLDEGSLVIFTLFLIWVEETIHMIPFIRTSGPLVGLGFLLNGFFIPWPRLRHAQSRESTKRRGSSSSLHATVSHSVIEVRGDESGTSKGESENNGCRTLRMGLLSNTEEESSDLIEFYLRGGKQDSTSWREEASLLSCVGSREFCNHHKS